MTKMHAQLGNTDAKIASLDSEVSYIKHDVEELRGEFSSLRKAVSEGFENINEALGRAQSTNWPVLFGGISLILVIIGMFFNSYAADLGRIEANQKQIMEDMSIGIQDDHDHALMEGHLPMQLRVEALEEATINLDTVLQREMRLLDDETQAQIQALGQRINSETDILERQALENRGGIDDLLQRLSQVEVASQLRHEQQETQFDSLEDRIEKNEHHADELAHPFQQTAKFEALEEEMDHVRDWMREHASENERSAGNMEARMEALERQIYGGMSTP